MEEIFIKAELDLEKEELKFGFIKLTDCAPIVIAKEKGFFEDEGLQVEVVAQPNWKTLLDNVMKYFQRNQNYSEKEVNAIRNIHILNLNAANFAIN